MSHQRCDTRMAEPSSRRRTFAADATWPACGRAAWIAGWKLVRDPCSASSDIAHATSAVRTSRSARDSPSEAIAAMNCVPLMSERPSFACSRTGCRPAEASASAPGIRTPSTNASPSPTSGSARCARGARSPLAPTEPRAGTCGTIPALSTASSSSTVSTRAPEYPFAIAFARSTIAARTTSSGYGSPTPQAWLRRSRSCSSSAWSSGIDSDTKRPKPVLTPYVCSPRRSSSSARERPMRSTALGASATARPPIATSWTSSTVRSSPVSRSGSVTDRECMTTARRAGQRQPSRL